MSEARCPECGGLLHLQDAAMAEMKMEKVRLQEHARDLSDALSFCNLAIDPQQSEETAEWELTDSRWRDNIRALHTWNDRLRAIADKLPTTADGITVVPDDSVWHQESDGTISERWAQWHPEDGRYWACWSINGPPVTVEECYSTREAAEAAETPT